MGIFTKDLEESNKPAPVPVIEEAPVAPVQPDIEVDGLYEVEDVDVIQLKDIHKTFKDSGPIFQACHFFTQFSINGS